MLGLKLTLMVQILEEGDMLITKVTSSINDYIMKKLRNEAITLGRKES